MVIEYYKQLYTHEFGNLVKWTNSSKNTNYYNLPNMKQII